MFEEKARDLKRETGCFSHNSIIGLKKSNLPHYSYFRMKNSPVVFRGNGLDLCSWERNNLGKLFQNIQRYQFEKMKKKKKKEERRKSQPLINLMTTWEVEYFSIRAGSKNSPKCKTPAPPLPMASLVLNCSGYSSWRKRGMLISICVFIKVVVPPGIWFRARCEVLGSFGTFPKDLFLYLSLILLPFLLLPVLHFDCWKYLSETKRLKKSRFLPFYVQSLVWFLFSLVAIMEEKG